MGRLDLWQGKIHKNISFFQGSFHLAKFIAVLSHYLFVLHSAHEVSHLAAGVAALWFCLEINSKDLLIIYNLQMTTVRGQEDG